MCCAWGYWGRDIYGNMLLDFRGESLLFKIPIIATSPDAAEIQIADQVIAILEQYNCPLSSLAIERYGAGTGIGNSNKTQG